LREVIDDAEASPRELIAASTALISADQTKPGCHHHSLERAPAD
jgi:hypothetical protein